MLAGISKPLIFVVISVLVLTLAYSSISAFNVLAEPDVRPADAKCNVWRDEGKVYQECCWTETDPNDPEGIELNYCQTCLVGVDCGPKYPDTFSPPTTGENIVPGDTGVLEQPPRPPSFDPTAPLQGGVLEQQEQQTPTPPGAVGPLKGGILEQGEGLQQGFFEQQQQPPAEQGAAELPPTDEGTQKGTPSINFEFGADEAAAEPPATEQTQPATVEEEQSVPVCQEGLEFNEDLGFCVPEDCPDGQVLDEESGICVLEEPEAVEEEPAQSEPEEEQPSEESDSGDDSSND